MAERSFRLLGSLEISVDGRLVAVKSTRQRVVLVALLLAANHVVTVDRLIDAVWEGRAPDTARVQIQICVAALRRSLGDPGVIETKPSGYVIRVLHEQMDYAQFDEGLARARAAAAEGRLEHAVAEIDAALALWRGPALAGLPGRVSEAMAHRFDERRLMALEDRAELRLALGAHRELVDELVALTGEHPLRERLCGFLMVALYRSGRQAEALACYQAARRALDRELGLQPGEELRRLEQAILAHDPDIGGAEAQRAGPTGRSAEAVCPPRQLPADIPDFVGHSGLVEELAEILTAPPATAARQEGVPVVVVLTGPPGGGKSAVAIHAAHRAVEAFPDGQLFIDLRGSEVQRVPAHEVPARFLRALGVPAESVPQELDERISLLRSQLAARRILVVLDDAADEGQVRSLIPGVPGSVVLITSRSRLAGLPGARVSHVKAMSERDGVELLGRIAGSRRVAADPEAVAELIRICDGLPLALRIAGVRLAANPHWSVGTLLELVSDEGSLLDEFTYGDFGIRALLSTVHNTLSERARWLFGLLSTLEMHDFTSATVAALLDVGPGESVRAIDELIHARLLDVSSVRVGEPPRYRLQSLVRVFAAERLAERGERGDTGAAEGLERVLRCLVTLSREAHMRIYTGDYTRLRGETPDWPPAYEFYERFLRDPMAWFDRERTFLRAAVTQAAKAGLDEMCWELAVTAVAIYEAHGLYDDWRETHLTALDATRAAGNRRGEAAVLASLGSLGIAQHSKDDTKMLHDALDLFETIGDTLGQALCLRNLAHLDRIQGRPDRAVERYQRSLEGFRRVADRGAQAHVLSGLARANLDLGRLGAAEALTKDSLAISQDLGNRRLQAQALCRLGEVFTLTGQLIAAKAVLEQALSLIHALGDRVGEAYAHNGLGTVSLQLGECASAETHYKRTMWLCEEVNERNAYAHAALGLGRVYSQDRRFDVAETFSVQALRAFTEQENAPMQVQAASLVKSIRQVAGDPDIT